MRNGMLMVVTCATLLWAGTALAAPTPQQKCDHARITAWKVYLSCMEAVLAKDATEGNVTFDENAAFAKCRHKYFKKWTGFQTNKYLKGSNCRNPDATPLARFVDNGDGTVTDRLTTLVWEKKTTDGSVQDEGKTYSWSTGAPWAGNGTVFTSFLLALDSMGLGGSVGWRLPTIVELETIVLDFACTGEGGSPTCSCGLNPCIDGTLGPTKSEPYWSATSHVWLPNNFAWHVHFGSGAANAGFYKTEDHYVYVRAVRGGL
jgi:hypothetical protein